MLTPVPFDRWDTTTTPILTAVRVLTLPIGVGVRILDTSAETSPMGFADLVVEGLALDLTVQGPLASVGGTLSMFVSAFDVKGSPSLIFAPVGWTFTATQLRELRSGAIGDQGLGGPGAAAYNCVTSAIRLKPVLSRANISRISLRVRQSFDNGAEINASIKAAVLCRRLEDDFTQPASWDFP